MTTATDAEAADNKRAAELGQVLQPIADAISTRSGRQWVVVPNCWWHARINSGDYSICVSYNSQKKRFAFSGDWPRDTTGRDHGPRGSDNRRVSIAADRPAGSIAADVCRRFVEWYLPKFDEMKASAENASNSASRQQRAADALAAIIGVSATQYGRPSTKFHAYRHGIQSVEVGSGANWVKIETDSTLPVEVAAEVLQLLAARLPAQAH
jgi:hypothetical protein